MWRKFGIALGGTGVAGAAAFSQQDEGTKAGMRRSAKFWQHTLPIFAHYRIVQWRMDGAPQEESDAAFAVLHNRYAPVAERLTLEMKGFYLKNAQFLSTLSDDFLPQQVRYSRCAFACPRHCFLLASAFVSFSLVLT